MSAQRASGAAFIPTRILSAAVGLVFVAAAAFPAVAPAQAASPWWGLTSGSWPTNLPESGTGRVVVTAENMGEANVDGSLTPVVLEDVLPEHLEVLAVEAVAGETGGLNRGPVLCSSPEPHQARCVFEGRLPSYEEIEMRIAVSTAGAASGEANMLDVSGGGANVATLTKPLSVGATNGFGVADYALIPEEEGGEVSTQAAVHPFQLTSITALDTSEATTDPNAQVPAGMAKDLTFQLPPGLIGNPTPFPQCTDAQFTTQEPGTFHNECEAKAAIGVALITYNAPGGSGGVTRTPAPLFNLKPLPGEPARFGFEVVASRVYIDTAVRSGADYGVTATVSNITQVAGFLASKVTFWGVPGDPAHDSARGWQCLHPFETETTKLCSADVSKPPPFLSLPTSCTGPLRTTVQADSWQEPHPAHPAEPPLLAEYLIGGLDGCNRLHFDPSIEVTPDLSEASKPTGLNVDLRVPHPALLNPEGLAESNLRHATVTLPEGVTLNPGGADGLQACTEAQAGFTGFAEFRPQTEPGDRTATFTPDLPQPLQPGANFCPDGSKVGTARILTPLLTEPIVGSVYLATPYQNPFGSLIALYLIADEPVSGTIVKQVGQVSLDPASGRLTTSFQNTPDVPAEDVAVHLFGGNRAPLVTPSLCGTYTTEATLAPWSANAASKPSSSFPITSGPDGRPCPSGGAPPFHPGLNAGARSSTAGSYSPLDLELTRTDSEQELTHFSLKLPPGLSGKLAGIPECSDAAIAAAKARSGAHGGQEEEEAPSCPAASEVGRTLAAAGVGSVLVNAPGKLYLAGPYHGSNLSVVSITAAHVGAFDLGTVLVRVALRINPETAEVFVDATGTDPLPHIIAGIPTHLRKILIYLDRPEFTLNPTSCERMSIASTVLGSGADFTSEADDQPVTASSPFQASDCAALGFKPKLKLSLLGGTKRGQNPKFKAVLNARPGDANIGSAQVTLPHSEFLDNAHIKTICTRVQFKEGNVPGEKCPKDSVYGFAKAITPILDEALQGPVYLRSSSHQLPDLVAALHNKQVDIALDGHVEGVKGGIRNTFEAVPDAPVTKFTLTMQGGSKGLLENSTDLCARPHRATSDFTGHNGKIYDTRPVLAVSCGKKGKHKGGKRRGHRGARR